MSTFDGNITEIPNISIDRFDNDNLNSSIYFLSHCHTDHMRGLDDWNFQKLLINRPNVYLYASPISVKILKGLYPVIQCKLKELALENATLIKFPYHNEFFSVTPLPAGHCPGSVMFLFETNKRILYTGDYRVCCNDLQKYSSFYSLGQLKRFDKLYLDTTFFKMSFLKFPLRKDSVNSICEIITNWTQQSKKHIIKIVLSATYGSEYLFMEIAKAACMPIHVSARTFEVYKLIPEMDKAVTINRDTQIHAGCGNNLKNICMKDDRNYIRVIRPSALWWENNDFSKGFVNVTEKNEYRVCYSSHASFEELKDFVIFLKPDAIEPCVVPFVSREKEIMFDLLKDVMSLYKEKSATEDEVKLFNIKTIDASSNENERDCTTPDQGNFDELDDILCSPPKNFKRKRFEVDEDLS